MRSLKKNHYLPDYTESFSIRKQLSSSPIMSKYLEPIWCGWWTL